MKVLVILLFSITLSGGYCCAQNIATKYPFDFEILTEFARYLSANDTIIPVNKSGKFYFINSHNKKLISNTSFDEAYPFNGKFALVKKGNKYGIIDKTMKFIIAPTYENAKDMIYGKEILIPNTEISITKHFAFWAGTFITDSTNHYLDDPAEPQIYFIKKGKKYFYTLTNVYIKNGVNKKSDAIYDTSYVFNLSFAVAKSFEKIGGINSEGKVIIPFIYTDYVGPKDLSRYASLFALKKDDQWHYFKEGKELFHNNIKPDMIHPQLFTFRVGELYNYFNNQGKIMLPHNYKWIDQSGNLAIDEKDEVVLFNSKKQEFIYYKH